MKVLILGSGGREHALAWKLKQSALCSGVFVAPGNAGTASIAGNVDMKVSDFQAIKNFVLDNDVKMVVVGPEDPLVEGIHDFFLDDAALRGIPVIGPKKDGAILEGSKEFSKNFMMEYHIPTAGYMTFEKETLADGLRFLDNAKPPFVLKADGLAAGKGVVILDDVQKAKDELIGMLAENKFGNAGRKVVIEEFLDGIELSVFVLTDGTSYIILPEAKDYKRIGDNDTGLNTGGMGAVSPVPFADAEFMSKVEQQIIIPTVNGLKDRKIDYQGFIFIGLMNVKGNPYVIEYNVRMGDPETEVVIPRIESDLMEIFLAVSKRKLNEISLKISPSNAVTIMLVSGGYPGEYRKGFEITGLENTSGCLVFHAGTSGDAGKIKTAGGRVIAVTGVGNSIAEALKISCRNAAKINFKDKYNRGDIGKDLLRLETAK
jgi:phosphoribosylamine--glycine ligase